MMVEDTGAGPVIILEEDQALHTRGADIVGPVTPVPAFRIVSYANGNSMIVIAPVISSPALAIPGDPVFRLAPDSRNQGRAVGAMLQDAGVDAPVPV